MELFPKSRIIPNHLINIKSVRTEGDEHYHDFFELMYVSKGTIYHNFNAQSAILNEGDFMFIDIGDVHSYTGVDFEIINLVFLPQIIDSSVASCKNLSELLKNPYFGIGNNKNIFYSLPKNVMQDNNKEVYYMLKSLMADVDNPQPMSSLIIRHALISLIIKIIQPKFSGNTTTTLSKTTNKLLKIVTERYNEDNLLITTANEMSYSLSHLSRTFKNEMGISFKEYLQKYRMDEAKRMLIYTDEKVNTIGLKVGYNDIKYFYSLFKKYTNLTPSEYRNLAKNIPEL